MACAALGLRLDLEFVITIDGVEIKTVALIHEIGGPNGMLVLTSYDREYADKLVELGYGYSVMSEQSENTVFDLDSWIEVFNDWGWSGEEGKEPSWYTGQPVD